MVEYRHDRKQKRGQCYPWCKQGVKSLQNEPYSKIVNDSFRFSLLFPVLMPIAWETALVIDQPMHALLKGSYRTIIKSNLDDGLGKES